MTRLRVHCFGVSLDGYGAGPARIWRIRSACVAPSSWNGSSRRDCGSRCTARATARPASTTRMAEHGFENIGAWILGRNMFGPVRGPWPDDSWKGWWGDEPPYHVPVFVLTHYARAPIAMKGGTAFHFVTDGIHSALEQAKAAAGGKDVRLGGGVATDPRVPQGAPHRRLHLALRPVVLGSGEILFSGIDLRALGYECVEHVAASARRMCSCARRRDVSANSL